MMLFSPSRDTCSGRAVGISFTKPRTRTFLPQQKTVEGIGGLVSVLEKGGVVCQSVSAR